MKGPLDAIFCRNVVIYFDKDTQRDLFARMARLQEPGAILFLGHSESLFKVSTDYSLIGKTIYRRVHEMRAKVPHAETHSRPHAALTSRAAETPKPTRRERIREDPALLGPGALELERQDPAGRVLRDPR